MALLKQKIQQDLNQAIKSKKELLSSVLRMMLAALLNKEKEKRYKLKETKDVPLTDEEIIEALLQEVKKRKEAFSEYERAGRQDLAEKEKKEAEILRKYLPEQMGQAELLKLAQEAVKKVSASELKDMGKVMAALMPQIKGRAEGAIVSKIVKELLTS